MRGMAAHVVPRTKRICARIRARDQRGSLMVELITVMAMLGTVMGGITTLFVGATQAEIDMNRRFQAQFNARVGLERLRRDVHCASSITPSGAASAVQLTLPVGCASGSGQFVWCTRNLGTNRWGLYRQAGSALACTGAGALVADYLTLANAFNFTPGGVGTLGKLRVELRVDIDPSATSRRYTLVDELVLRNDVR